jgi:Rne/Rng family ribonuclease
VSAELVVSRLAGSTWAALRERGVSVELHVEDDDGPRVGRIVKARVDAVQPSLQAAFLTIDGGHRAFLRSGDLPGGGKPPPIEQRLSAGSALLVQIARDPLGGKDARATARIALPGRYLLLRPDDPRRSVSNRIRDPKEQERLSGILDGLPGEVGYIARTAARGAGEERLREGAGTLLEQWRGIERAGAAATAPSVVLREPETLDRLLRDAPAGGVDRLLLDDPRDVDRARERLREWGAADEVEIALHRGSVSLIEASGLLQELRAAREPRVRLPSGGRITIEPTRALVSVDVDSASLAPLLERESGALQVNLEAAREIARQLRLRDLGGAVVVDFLDLALAPNRRRVASEIERALAEDPARTRIGGFGRLGLFELTRERTRVSIPERLTRPDEHGGRRKAGSLIAAEIAAELWRRDESEAAAVAVRVHPLHEEETRRRLAAHTRTTDATVEPDAALEPDGYRLERR